VTHHPLFYFDEDVWNFSVSFFLSFEGFFVRVRAVVFEGFFVTRSVWSVVGREEEEVAAAILSFD
jgi:hypothetical protein